MPQPNITNADDRREIFSQLHDHSVAIAGLQSGVESLASSTESGFRNITNRIDDLGQTLRGQRPQIGVVATVVFSGCALVGALAGFALKSAVLPMEVRMNMHGVLIDRNHDEVARRLSDLESVTENIVSDQDDVQNNRLERLEKLLDE